MIDFELTEDQLLFQDLARKFSDRYIRPVARELDEEERAPLDLIEPAYQSGLMNLTVPEQFGGQGLDHLTAAIIVEELAAGCAGVATTLFANGLALLPIMIAGTDEQKHQFLTPVVSQPRLASFCLTEPGAGSDAGSVATTAAKNGDDYVINGTKTFITNGGIADLYVVVVSTDRSRGQRGLSLFCVPADTPGVSAGRKEKKMGIRSSQTADVIFEDVRVPAQNMLGRPGRGFQVTMKTLDMSRPLVGAMAVGIAREALDQAISYSRARRQFGQAIASFQAVQLMLADMAAAVESARLLVWRACRTLDLGLDAGYEASMAKWVAGDVAMRVTTDAVQVLGGYGYSRDYPVEKLMRDAKIMQIYEGTNQIQRLQVARDLIKRG